MISRPNRLPQLSGNNRQPTNNLKQHNGMKQDMIVILDLEAPKTPCLPEPFVLWVYIVKFTRTISQPLS